MGFNMKSTDDMMNILNSYPPTGRNFEVINTIVCKNGYKIEIFWCGVIISKFGLHENLYLTNNYTNKHIFWLLPYIPKQFLSIQELKNMSLGPVFSREVALNYLDKFHSMTMDFILNFKTSIVI